MKVLAINIRWYGELGWILDEALQERGLSTPNADDVEHIYSSTEDPGKLAERAASQMKKPGWTGVRDSFVVAYGEQKSHVFIFGD